MESLPHDAATFSSVDPVELGTRLRNFRILLNLTQGELAAQSGISTKTLFQIESGKSARFSSVLKVCHGFGTTLDEFLTRLPVLQVQREGPVVHRNAAAEWYAPLDRRKRIPENNAALVQDPAERRRLGKLGFTPVFLCYPTLLMPNGPGMTFVELYARFDESFNKEIYREALLHCLRGRARFGIGGDVVEIAEGDVVGFQNGELRWGEPVFGASDELPTSLIWVGAVRLGRVAPAGGKRTLVRKPRPKA